MSEHIPNMLIIKDGVIACRDGTPLKDYLATIDNGKGLPDGMSCVLIERSFYEYLLLCRHLSSCA